MIKLFLQTAQTYSLKVLVSNNKPIVHKQSPHTPYKQLYPTIELTLSNNQSNVYKQHTHIPYKQCYPTITPTLTTTPIYSLKALVFQNQTKIYKQHIHTPSYLYNEYIWNVYWLPSCSLYHRKLIT